MEFWLALLLYFSTSILFAFIVYWDAKKLGISTAKLWGIVTIALNFFNVLQYLYNREDMAWYARDPEGYLGAHPNNEPSLF